ncbi:hypothetical protein QYH69_35575 [Paraburkholderia sp. SARCC-3016]|uniref:hypothetical protein n=1 Tax=Paraburkholderia sp. SARCC-3016 TaxID=3058611 RepID=UPI002809D216|nr:hypothetical protein [Paraburkholderia sp. SARCC-3016]MDQ7982528.1 hypothetical protein [Paraburkholderia sp. SARCC-3016]
MSSVTNNPSTTTAVDYTAYPSPNSSSVGDTDNRQQLLQEIMRMLDGGGACPAPSTPSGGGTSNVTASYNRLVSDLSANGTPGSTIASDAANLGSTLDKAGLGNSDLATATNNVKESLSDGTFSQQGSLAALRGAAHRDGLQGALTPQVGSNNPVFDGGSKIHTQEGGHGSLVANAKILATEMFEGAPASQIKNNASALETEAANAGDSGVATAAQNIANSIDDGSYSAAASVSALKGAVQAAPGNV